MKKKLMSGFLAFCMLSAMAPGALAETEEKWQAEKHHSEVTYSDGATVILGNLAETGNTEPLIQNVTITQTEVNKNDFPEKCTFDKIYEVKITGEELREHKSYGNGWPIGLGVPIPQGASNDKQKKGTDITTGLEIYCGYGPANRLSLEANKAYADPCSQDTPNVTPTTDLKGLTGRDENITQYYNYYWNIALTEEFLNNTDNGGYTAHDPAAMKADGQHGFIITRYKTKDADGKDITESILYDVDFSEVTIKEIDVLPKNSDGSADSELVVTPNTLPHGFYTKNNTNWTAGGITLKGENPVIKLTAPANSKVTPPRDGKAITIKYGDKGKMCYFAESNTKGTYECACATNPACTCSPKCTFKDGEFTGGTCTAPCAAACGCTPDASSNKCTNVVGFTYDYDDTNDEGTITIFGDGVVKDNIEILCEEVEHYDIITEKDSNLIAEPTRVDTATTAHIKDGEKLCSLDVLAKGSSASTTATVQDIALKVTGEAQEKGGQLPQKLTVKLNGKELKQLGDGDTDVEGYQYVNNGTTGTIKFHTTANETLKAGKIEIIGKALLAKSVTSVNTGIEIVLPKTDNTDSLVTSGGIAPGGTKMAGKFIELKAKSADMMLPEKLNSITMDDQPLVEGKDYTYSQSSGKITFKGEELTVTGPIKIDATPTEKPNTERVLPVTVKDTNNAIKAEPTTFTVGDALAGKTITLSLLPGMEDQYALPTKLQSIKVGATTLTPETDYEYNPTTGEIAFTKDCTVTAPKESELVITATAAVKCVVDAGDEVDVDPTNVTNGSGLANAVFTLTAKEGTGKTLKGVTEVKNNGVTIPKSNYSFADGKLTFSGTCTQTVKGDIEIICDLVDETAPDVSVLVNNDAITKTTAEILIDSNEDGKAYVKVVEAEKATRAATAPTAEDIVKEGTPLDITGGTTLEVKTKENLNQELTPGTKYVAYVVVKDAYDNQSEMKLAPFTTVASDSSKKITEVLGQTVTTKGDGTVSKKETIEVTLSDGSKTAFTAADVKAEQDSAIVSILNDVNDTLDSVDLEPGTKHITVCITAEDKTKAFYDIAVTLPTVAKTETQTTENADGTKDVVAEVPKEAVTEQALKDVESIVIDATAGVEEDKAGGAEVTIPSEAVETLAKAEEVSVTIDTPVATVTVPPEVTKKLDEHSKANESEPVKLSIKKNKTVTPPEGAVIDAYDLSFVGAKSGNEVKFDLSASKNKVEVKFKVKKTLSANYDRKNPIGLYLMELIDGVAKYTQVKDAFYDNRTGFLTMNTPHFSTYVQMKWDTYNKIINPDGKVEPAPLELVETDDGMYYVKGAEKGHWLYFYLNEKDTEEGGYGRVQPGVVKVNDDPQEAIFLPALDGTLTVWELKTRPTFIGGALDEKPGDVVLTNGLGQTVESAMN